ncbi:MAG: hypothetical protein ABSB99_03555 [Acidimicrobiales bacterium]
MPESSPVPEVSEVPGGLRPAYYATVGGGWRDWWTLLHPPYTVWHLSYVVVGASLAPRPSATRLVASVLAFFFAVGIAAHALDELHGRPLRTKIPSGALMGVTVGGLAVAVTLGVLGVVKVGPVLVPFVVVGPLLVVAYNAELFGGIVHSDVGFAAAWGCFPLLCAYVAETSTMRLAPLLAAVGAFALSYAQRKLSTPARLVRRSAVAVDGLMRLTDGSTTPIEERTLLAPLEQALRAMSWSTVFLAAALAVARFS